MIVHRQIRQGVIQTPLGIANIDRTHTGHAVGSKPIQPAGPEGVI